MDKKQTTVSRRTFLSSAALVGASGALGTGSLLTSCAGGGKKEDELIPLRPSNEVYIPDIGDKAIAGKPIKAGLIGCGSRGSGAALNFLEAGDGVSIVACADAFKDRLERCRETLKAQKNVIADNQCFVGLDAYKKVCESDVDVVLIASPQLFHPIHFKYAIDQGKNVFVEKPAAVDPTGFRTYMMAIMQARTKGLCVVPGTHCHYNRGYIESYKRVQEGQIGRIVSANVWFCQGDIGFVRRRPEWSDVEYMIRDFFNWKWLSGDHVVDQFVHAIDIFSWFSHMKPERVLGIGSRLRRYTGDIYDNFSMDYDYEGGIQVRGMARQIDNCDGRVAEFIQGTKGSFRSQNNAQFSIHDLEGNIVWQYDSEAAKAQFKQHNPYVLEHVDMINNLRRGTVVNNAEFTATSSMAAIMARESAYTGKSYTWDEMTKSEMNFMPPDLTLDKKMDMSRLVAPMPGTVSKQDAPFWL
jgi:predicted dehydrogenase